MSTLLLSTASLTLHHDATRASLYVTWLQCVTAHSPLLGYHHISQQVQLTQSRKLLVDAVANENGWQEVSAWLENKCFSALNQAGVTTLAWVLPHQSRGMRTIQSLLATILAPSIGVFHDTGSAHQWLHHEAG